MTIYRDSAISIATITRPADTNIYDAYDVISTNPGSILTFSNTTKLPGSKIIIINANIMININASPSGMNNFRLHLYSQSPIAIDDNEAFNLIEDDRSKYLGFIPIDTPLDFGDTVYVQKLNINKIIELYKDHRLYGILQTVDSFTPSSEDEITISLGILGAIGI